MSAPETVTILNTTTATISIDDVTPPVSITSNQQVTISRTQFEQSQEIADNLQTGAFQVIASGEVLIEEGSRTGKVIFLPSTTELSSGQTNWFFVGQYRQLNLYVNATSVSGTLQLYVEDSPDGGSTAYPLDTLTAITASGIQPAVSLQDFGENVRIRWTVGTSATFSVIGIGKS